MTQAQNEFSINFKGYDLWSTNVQWYMFHKSKISWIFVLQLRQIFRVLHRLQSQKWNTISMGDLMFYCCCFANWTHVLVNVRQILCHWDISTKFFALMLRQDLTKFHQSHKYGIIGVHHHIWTWAGFKVSKISICLGNDLFLKAAWDGIRILTPCLPCGNQEINS